MAEAPFLACRWTRPPVADAHELPAGSSALPQRRSSRLVRMQQGRRPRALERCQHVRRASLFSMVIALIPIVWLLAELFVAISVADAIGVLDTVLLLLVSWPLGAWVLRSQGRAAWRRLERRGGGRALARPRGARRRPDPDRRSAADRSRDSSRTCSACSRCSRRRGRCCAGSSPATCRAGSWCVPRGSPVARGQYDVDSTATDVDQPSSRHDASCARSPSATSRCGGRPGPRIRPAAR